MENHLMIVESPPSIEVSTVLVCVLLKHTHDVFVLIDLLPDEQLDFLL